MKQTLTLLTTLLLTPLAALTAADFVLIDQHQGLAERRLGQRPKFEAELISPAEASMRTRGASNAGYHYLGCAKTFALMGKA